VFSDGANGGARSPLSRHREGNQDRANCVGIFNGGDQAQAPAVSSFALADALAATGASTGAAP
jgi:hypothetical protein